ncbi:hypothetical protein [Alicyclobacillus dauci]|uniref:Uncharacterized protein n=1 Tax=Alicyclobacillus dauci TaxID=1475485 RepID=A0ABY6Z588_9BACL|nr:hypothetical protein [Alicyclobacillus dauci]WAH37491.1 hypothetical protein NZD86_02835 [Alicyclobacillus dauci]
MDHPIILSAVVCIAWLTVLVTGGLHILSVSKEKSNIISQAATFAGSSQALSLGSMDTTIVMGTPFIQSPQVKMLYEKGEVTVDSTGIHISRY